MFKITLYSLAFTVAIVPAIAFAEAPSTTGVSSSADASAPSVGATDSSAIVSTPSTSQPVTSADISAPSTGSTGSSATAAPSTGAPVTSADASTPSTGSPTSSADNSAPSTGAPVTSAGSSGPSVGAPVTSAGGSVPSVSEPVTSAGTPSTPVTPVINNGGGTSYGGSSGGFLGGGFSPVPLATSVTTTTTDSCPLLTSYLQFGSANSSLEVSKLQAFLKDSQGLNVVVNGTFDAQTENAVRAFQTKYMSQVMGPWGATQPSGYVYITTEKKINELACNTPFALSASDLAIINAYKSQENQANAAQNTAGPADQFVGPNGSMLPTTPDSASSTLNPVVGQNGSSTSNDTAAAANAPAFWKFWNFIKGLF